MDVKTEVKTEVVEISKIELKPDEFLIARCPEDWSAKQVWELSEMIAEVAKYYREDHDPRGLVLERVIVLPHLELDGVTIKP